MKRKINLKALDILKYFEGLRLETYKDVKGILTIGYGHTGQDVIEGQKITSLQAEMLLKQDVEIAERAVDRLCKPKLNDNQFGALVCLVYNIGQGAFEKSTLLKELNMNHFDKAATEFLRWNKAGGKEIKGLSTRRRAERDLFLMPIVEA